VKRPADHDSRHCKASPPIRKTSSRRALTPKKSTTTIASITVAHASPTIEPYAGILFPSYASPVNHFFDDHYESDDCERNSLLLCDTDAESRDDDDDYAFSFDAITEATLNDSLWLTDEEMKSLMV
jgi:hypothetical protein